MKSSRMLLAGCVVIVAAAVAASAAQKPQKSVKATRKAAAKRAPTGAILYDQTGNQDPINAWTSQDFEPAFDAYDNQGADDFVVPAPGWDINEVFAPGQNSGVAVPGVNVTFFNDGGGIPGTVACNYTNIPTGDDGAGNLTIALAPTCVLAPGTYWVSAQARMDFGTGGQWFWFGSIPQANGLAQWQNPGGGFGTPCSTWGPLSTCIGGNLDFSYALSGVPVPVELQGFTVQ